MSQGSGMGGRGTAGNRTRGPNIGSFFKLREEDGFTGSDEVRERGTG